MSGQRRRRCASIETALGECPVFAGLTYRAWDEPHAVKTSQILRTVSTNHRDYWSGAAPGVTSYY